jgi:hypothetical protein
MQTGGETVNFAVNSFYDGFDAGPVRHRTTLQARINLLKKMEATISGEYGKVKVLYGIEEKNVFGCRLLMKYTL